MRVLLTDADIRFSGTVRHAHLYEREDGRTVHVLGIHLELNDEMRVEVARLLAAVISPPDVSSAETQSPDERASALEPLIGGSWRVEEPIIGGRAPIVALAAEGPIRLVQPDVEGSVVVPESIIGGAVGSCVLVSGGIVATPPPVFAESRSSPISQRGLSVLDGADDAGRDAA